MRKLLGAVSLAVLLCWGAVDGVRAENVKGRWHLGGGFSFISTSDDIRNNAAVVLLGNPARMASPIAGTRPFSSPIAGRMIYLPVKAPSRRNGAST